MKKTVIATLIASSAVNSFANNETILDEITVTAICAKITPFSTPASIDVIEGKDIRQKSGMNVSLSEALQGIAGLVALDRHNYAQILIFPRAVLVWECVACDYMWTAFPPQCRMVKG
ncbi:TonB-dependent receptor [Rodentibacter sp. Ppn85]|uniref:TonB-dependent receptor n=1 Tax=Rodentibacter sp. Ppn85 TaxID=1908525 RepID=UPI00117AC7EC|nr:TonB-dependent receptor [Rodentibacter sp. Ppn85]